MPRIRKIIPGVDPRLLIKDAAKLMPDPTRRLFLRGGASLGALTFLTGCDIIDGPSAEKALRRFPTSTIARRRGCSIRTSLRRPIPRARSRGRSRSTPTIRKTKRPRSTRTTTSSRSAAWSTTRNRGRWTSSTRCRRRRRSPATSASRAGARSANGPACGCREFLRRVGADTRAKYVWFRCAEGYSTSIDMPTALHPQTQMTFKFDDQILPRKYGFPMKCRMPTKLGFKNPKYVMAMARHQQLISAATGKTRATTGSAG